MGLCVCLALVPGVIEANWTTIGTGQDCHSHGDCGPDQWCQGSQCVHPCPSSCPVTAFCKVHEHRPICSCPPTTIGDPHQACHSIGCKTDKDCPYREKCYNSYCQDPCHTERPCAPTATCISVNHSTTCTCRPGYTGNPTTSCEPTGCLSSDECLNHEACYKGSCTDPCLINSPCGAGAICKVEQHIVSCICLSGYVGDPFAGCSPTPTPQCISDLDCTDNYGCIDGLCHDLCTRLQPCGLEALCRVVNVGQQRTMLCECPKGYKGSAYDKCIKLTEIYPSCKHDGDCLLSFACVNSECQDLCDDNLCAENAECRTVNHRALCYCPFGYTGDGHKFCSKIKCLHDADCLNNSVCSNGKCIEACLLSNPCGDNAHCISVEHSAQCQCEPGIVGDPYLSCATLGCSSNTNCPSTHACLSGKCVNVCKMNNPCGATQKCNVVNHQPNCSCPVGFAALDKGCFPVTPLPVIGCSSDADCHNGEGCINGNCEDLCLKNPCGRQAVCKVKDGQLMSTITCQCGHGLIGDPFTECIKIPVTEPGCTYENDCLSQESCLEGKCVDLCSQSPCAPGALCRTVNHRSICSCAAGYHGNPYSLCTPVGCTQKSECQVTEACINGRCSDPCETRNPCGLQANCEPKADGPVCTCPKGFQGDPYDKCLPSGCSESSQCSHDFECIDQQCQDPCLLLQCVTNAVCIVTEHKAKCECLNGYMGDAELYCALPVITECSQDYECPLHQGCINGKCVDLCEAIHPCGFDAICSILDNKPLRAMSCSCPDGYDGDPQIACTPSKAISGTKCVSDISCPLMLACISGKCQSPCPAGCGAGASCSVINHHPVCHCQPSYAGDPEIGCFKINCQSDRDCLNSEVCTKFYCEDPCLKDNSCPESAICVSSNHRSQCHCPPGSSGNPDISCKVMECITDLDCRSFEACISGECQDPCIHLSPCASNAICKVNDHKHECTCPPGLFGNPHFSCIPPKDPIQCASDQDCPPTDGCILESLVTRYHNKVSAVYIRLDDSDSKSVCRDLCKEHKPCGINSICSVIDSKPRKSMSCACPNGYHGDAKIECRRIPSQVGCIKDTDCLFSEACVNGACRDPCNCGLNAQCHVVNHRPFCTCAHGHTGDPAVVCHRVHCMDDLDCPGNKACINNDCTDPCASSLTSVCAPSATCTVQHHKLQCACLPGDKGNPKLQCLPIGCKAHDECPPSHLCENGKCQNPCDKEICGVGAFCIVQRHNQICNCPNGYVGDPYVVCRPTLSTCAVDHDCGIGLVCARGSCKDPCKQEKPCATYALCTVQETRPVKSVTCTCPAGFTGDAKIQCWKSMSVLSLRLLQHIHLVIVYIITTLSVSKLCYE
ncbi:hypothetical protein SK128_022664 [Halocaridina rubra]|uniref:EGF-like domain-containing protein n=1 Tax=Halocaridina rubra TaxID=373956 RepID=A0AAN9A7N4_HALRR